MWAETRVVGLRPLMRGHLGSPPLLIKCSDFMCSKVLTPLLGWLVWSERRESNPRHQLGRLRSYHYTTLAAFIYPMQGGGEDWIRTNVHIRDQIYSLTPLTTRPPLLKLYRDDANFGAQSSIYIIVLPPTKKALYMGGRITLPTQQQRARS